MTTRGRFELIVSLQDKPNVNEEEAKMIWTAVKTNHARMLIKTLWYTGLRISEALALTPNDLDRDGMDYRLRITRLKKRKSSKQEYLPVPRGYALDLLDYIKATGIKPHAPLFPATRKTYWLNIRTAAKEAGLPNWHDIHPHSFRHGFIYDKAMKGVHPYVLSKLAGHEGLNTTMGYYRPTEEDLRQAMEL